MQREVVHRKLRVQWAQLVQFCERDYFSIGDDKAIAIYQWLLRESPSEAKEMIAGHQYENHNGPGYWMNPTPFASKCDQLLDWRFDLRLRFAGLLLARAPSNAVRRWQRRIRVHVDHTTEISVRHRDCDFVGAAIDQLGTLAGRRFRVSPNSIHPRAVLVKDVLFHVGAERYSVILVYGYIRAGGEWRIAIESKPRELFGDFIERARLEFESQMVKTE